MTLTRASGEGVRDQAVLRVLVQPVSDLELIPLATTTKEPHLG
jgi:hypothetical protein